MEQVLKTRWLTARLPEAMRLRKIADNRRVRLLWFLDRNPVAAASLSHVLRNTFSLPASRYADKVIHRIETADGMSVLFMRGYPSPLYFPQTMSRWHLNLVLGESRPWHWHYYETAETPVTTQDIVFDCGAAEGFFSFAIVNRAKAIYAFEPLPEWRKCLEKTFAGRDHVRIIPAALSDKIGTAYIQSNGVASSITAEPTDAPIEIETIDHFVSRTGVIPTYLKADVEGFERQLIAGAENTIRQHKPKIAITTYHLARDAEALSAAIRRFNPSYKLRLKGIEHHRGEPLMLHAY